MKVIFFTGRSVCLTICLIVRTLPDTEEVQSRSEDSLYRHLSDQEVIAALAQSLSQEFCTVVVLGNIRTGSIKMDMSIEDPSRLEYIKYLSDKGVLSDIIDCILMTPDFISSCQAQDVAIEAFIDEESYANLKIQSGKCYKPAAPGPLSIHEWKGSVCNNFLQDINKSKFLYLP